MENKTDGLRWYEIAGLLASLAATLATSMALAAGVGLSVMALDSCGEPAKPCSNWALEHGSVFVYSGWLAALMLVFGMIFFHIAERRAPSRWCAVLAPIAPLAVVAIYAGVFPG